MNIPFQSKLAKFKNITNRNEAFDKLSPKDKRREIAYDALNLVITRQVMASEDGDYWNSSLQIRTKPLHTPKELQCLLVDKLPTCQVCQRGLMMVSQIRLGNTLSPSGAAIQNGSNSNIKGFSIDSFGLMESLYEGWHHIVGNHPYEMNTQEMMANICCNVINNGDFKITDTTDYLSEWGIKISKKKIILDSIKFFSDTKKKVATKAAPKKLKK